MSQTKTFRELTVGDTLYKLFYANNLLNEITILELEVTAVEPSCINFKRKDGKELSCDYLLLGESFADSKTNYRTADDGEKSVSFGTDRELLVKHIKELLDNQVQHYECMLELYKQRLASVEKL